MVIDGHVDILPARSGRVLATVTGDAVAGAPETAETLDVQMQHVTGGVVFVAVVRLGRVEVAEAVQAGGLHQARHGTEPDVQFLGDLAVGLALPASVKHLLRERGG